MRVLLDLARPAIEDGRKVEAELPIVNTDRTVGTILSNEIARKWGTDLLPDSTVTLKFKGSAGQSFGAFLAKGVTLELEGDANDYVGKGLSGGRVIVYPPKESRFNAEENVLVGNVCLYGATSGEAYFRGRAAERFAGRNAGASAVSEGVGDHGCEYMTGGRVVVLGPTGRNLAAGMSVGIAYVWTPDRSQFQINCNCDMVLLESLEEEADLAEVLQLVEAHARYTGSTVPQSLLSRWQAARREFTKVMPTDYKRVLLQHRLEQVPALA